VKRLGEWSKTNWLVWAAAIAYLIVASTRPRAAAAGAVLGLQTFAGLAVTLVCVFVIVGLFQVWISEEFIVKHLGEESGFKGLVLGAGLGTLVHGPLVGVFPLLRALLLKGARVGVVVVIVSTWAIKLPLLPLELTLFGWKFTLLREGLLLVSAFIIAPVMELMLGKGWAAQFRAAAEE
jgi:uncharacterized protein